MSVNIGVKNDQMFLEKKRLRTSEICLKKKRQLLFLPETGKLVLKLTAALQLNEGCFIQPRVWVQAEVTTRRWGGPVPERPATSSVCEWNSSLTLWAPGSLLIVHTCWTCPVYLSTPTLHPLTAGMFAQLVRLSVFRSAYPHFGSRIMLTVFTCFLCAAEAACCLLTRRLYGRLLFHLSTAVTLTHLSGSPIGLHRG